MTIVQFFQSLPSSVFSPLMSVLGFIGSHAFFIVVFSVVYLFFSKTNAVKLAIFDFFNFLFGGLALKNIFKVSRPYDVDSSLFADRSAYQTYAFPSVNLMNFSGLVTFGVPRTKTFSKNSHSKLFSKILLSVCAVLLFLVVASSDIYFAKDYFWSVILSGVLGVGTYLLIFKATRKIDYKILLFALILPVLLLIIFCSQWFSAGSFSQLFSTCGFFSAVILGSFLEDKFVKSEVKNNLILSTLKAILLFITLILFYFLNKFVLSSMGILIFAGYFLLGICITLLLPFLFKICTKYCYIFAHNVSESHLVFSKIALSTRDTEKIACKISKHLKDGDVVVLEGDLGAGKSVVVRDILKLRNVHDKITSPTFTLVNVYHTKTNTYYHFDMYRIEDEMEVKNIGFEEILDDPNAIKFVEWPSRVKDFLPQHFKKVTITKLGKNSRNIILEEF
jgi:tRNA threonylcarbamoyladenosine biosynthesis protein TsaE